MHLAFSVALLARRPLLARLHAEHTDAYRLLHGTVEGVPGVAIDRYGPHLLVQSFRDPLVIGELEVLAEMAGEAVGAPLELAYRHRPSSGEVETLVSPLHNEAVLTECGVHYRSLMDHRGRDPLLFLDLRVVRRHALSAPPGANWLNLFAYTCGVGVAAAVGGAHTVWNVDFAQSALDFGAENLLLNPPAALAERRSQPLLGQVAPAKAMRFIKSDAISVMRQLAGLSVKGRARKRPHQHFEPRQFDRVVLDPPRWAKSPFGAVDLVRDYQSLFKPALLLTKPGGVLVCTNNVASIDLDEWRGDLERCAEKAGRPALAVEVLTPEADFPSPDGRHPLKILSIRC